MSTLYCQRDFDFQILKLLSFLPQKCIYVFCIQHYLFHFKYNALILTSRLLSHVFIHHLGNNNRIQTPKPFLCGGQGGIYIYRLMNAIILNADYSINPDFRLTTKQCHATPNSTLVICYVFLCNFLILGID